MSFKSKKTKHVFSDHRKHLSLILVLSLWGMSIPLFGSHNTLTQTENPSKIVRGIVLDEQDEPMIGVNIIEKGTGNGTITDANGRFQLKLQNLSATMVVSYIGYQSQELRASTAEVRLNLIPDARQIEEVVVVGYGSQKKASVVGSIVQARGEDLKRSGGVSDLSQALTGNLPGITTIQATGKPGEENAKIYIRGRSTWNNTDPLILVDGIERKLNDVDPNEIESISILKDASATAVYGVEGANGVILITTKRGKLGKPVLTVEANSVSKTVSKIYQPSNLIDALHHQNYAIEHELAVDPLSWINYFPTELIQYYDKTRYPDSEYPQYADMFPNVNWPELMLKDRANSSKLNMSLRGGTDFLKYFSSLSYTKEGDIMNTQDLGMGYNPEFSYSRFNYRNNLDFNITSSTRLTVNLSGYLATQNTANNSWVGIYSFPANVYRVQYDDGSYGQHENARLTNPFVALNRKGMKTTNLNQINTDYKLTQNFDFITKGLSAGIDVSLDYNIVTASSIDDTRTLMGKYYLKNIVYATPEEKDQYVVYIGNDLLQSNYFPIEPPVSRNPETVTSNAASRNLFYQFKLEYAREFNKHDVTALALVNRRERSRGNNFKTFREDWVGRVTYNYDRRYFLELNGAYNGSDNFAPGYRFAFFPSLALGWTLTNEQFMINNIPQLSLLKFRVSTGKTGNDRIGSDKWPYVGSFAAGVPVKFGHYIALNSPYGTWYENTIANPDIHWEVSKKHNYGVEFGIFENIVSGNFDYYKENRTDVFLNANQRNIPKYAGYLNNPAGNIGIVDSWGWELELKFTKTFNNKLRLWSNYALTFANNVIRFKEDAEFAPSYQKNAGFALGQTRTRLNSGIIQDWNEMYGGVLYESNALALPGDFRQIDFNADGIITNDDVVPYMYSSIPQNTYSWSLGSDYKGFSAMVQFYGVYNTTRQFIFEEFKGQDSQTVLYDNQINNAWLPQANRTTDASYHGLRYTTKDGSSTDKGNFYLYDGSFLRLKTMEFAYTFNNNKYLKNAGISNLRLYVNGNDLFLWSDIPYDYEGGVDNPFEMYPTTKRINVGTRITF